MKVVRFSIGLRIVMMLKFVVIFLFFWKVRKGLKLCLMMVSMLYSVVYFVFRFRVWVSSIVSIFLRMLKLVISSVGFLFSECSMLVVLLLLLLILWMFMFCVCVSYVVVGIVLMRYESSRVSRVVRVIF